MESLPTIINKYIVNYTYLQSYLIYLNINMRIIATEGNILKGTVHLVLCHGDCHFLAGAVDHEQGWDKWIVLLLGVFCGILLAHAKAITT